MILILHSCLQRNDNGIKNAAKNMAVIKKLVLNSLRFYKKKFNIRNSLKGLRLASSWSDQAREKIILNLWMVV